MSTPEGKQGFVWEEWSRGGDLCVRVSVPATLVRHARIRLLALDSQVKCVQ
jgi:hypothetical protein